MATSWKENVEDEIDIETETEIDVEVEEHLVASEIASSIDAIDDNAIRKQSPILADELDGDDEESADEESADEESADEESADEESANIDLRGFAKRFHGDVRELVKKYMVQFFSNKMFHCGGKIPNSLLLAEWRISLVLNYNIVRGVERAYACLEHLITQKDLEDAKLSGEVTDDIKLVNETLHLLARSYIPQQFAGGMMLLYLEFVEGIDIGKRP